MPGQTLFLIVVLFVPAIVLLGFVVGPLINFLHLRALDRREAEFADMIVTDTRSVPGHEMVRPAAFVAAEVVISSDPLRSILARLKKLIGGELRAFDPLLNRARREALLRMLAQARAMNAAAVVNVRFMTSNIGSMRRKGGRAMVEVVAYGTAVGLAARGSGA